MLSSIQREHPEALARPLKVDMAYPSHHIAGLDKEYLGLIESEDNLRLPESGPGRSNALFVSTANLISPIQFNSALSNLLAHDTGATTSLLLEIGPDSTLAKPMRQICVAVQQPCNYISSQVRGNNSAASFLSALCKLYQGSVPMNWKALFPEDRKTLSGLPQYPWDHSNGSFWFREPTFAGLADA
ncbi:hypothetical protein F4821DRAFT_260298 [Hypoxylon rubiginosum]|uniref:Uncharacterized protein n=1 Tax=Hypoxylon rubiginosum TaxID=110542 RepID=A0ACC0D0Z4_9PEZI|nr:hypothetical protein F4821DRAFT_260298 [Hypoxylon rubiginosum]